MSRPTPERSFDATSRTTITSLPNELIQEIAWYSSNPNLYLVSYCVRSRLCPEQDFVRDLALLLFCNRKDPGSAWFRACLPWHTSQARERDLQILEGDREEFQRQVISLEYITVSRLVLMIRHVLEAWVDINFPFRDNLSDRQTQRLETYLFTAGDACLKTEDSPPEELPLINCEKDHLVEDQSGNRLILSYSSGMSVIPEDQNYAKPRYVVNVLHVPTRLLKNENMSGNDELAKTLLYRTRMDSLNHSIVKKYSATAKPKWMHV